MYYRLKQTNAFYATPNLGLPDGISSTDGYLFDGKDQSGWMHPGQTYMPALRRGEIVPKEEEWRITKFIYLKGKIRQPNPHSLNGLLRYWIVSAEFKNIVEQLEPGRSQFSPVEFRDFKTKEVRTDVCQYYFWNLLNCRFLEQVYDVPAMAANGNASYRDEPLGNGNRLRAWEILASSYGLVLMRPNALGTHHISWVIDNNDVQGIQYRGAGEIECDEVFAAEIRKLKYSGVELLPLKMSDETA